MQNTTGQFPTDAGLVTTVLYQESHVCQHVCIEQWMPVEGVFCVKVWQEGDLGMKTKLNKAHKDGDTMGLVLSVV